MFDQYDPKQHTILWEMNNGEPPPTFQMVYKFGKEAEAVPGAIFMKKAEPSSPANQTQPSRSDTD